MSSNCITSGGNFYMKKKVQKAIQSLSLEKPPPKVCLIPRAFDFKLLSVVGQRQVKEVKR